MTYKNILSVISGFDADQLRKFDAEVAGLTAGAVLDSWYYRGLCTPKVLEAVKAMEPAATLDAKTIEKMHAKKARELCKRSVERVKKLEAADGARDVEHIYISVEWKRSRVWGYNPTATVRGFHEVTEDYASGCGYDKESAAIAGAFNKNTEVMRILYNHAEAGGVFPYGVHTFAGLPSFDGGCGVSVFYEIFKACGFKFEQVASGKHFAAYKITKM